MIRPIRLPRGREVPESIVRERATTAGGPGGQHANRSATRVEVGVPLDELPLTESEVARVRARLASRIDGDVLLWVGSGERRSQLQNRRAARERMAELLLEALHVDAPRRPSRPSRGAQLRLREAKRRSSQKKRSRSWRPGDPD
jgi:ribosome-associated protein